MPTFDGLLLKITLALLCEQPYLVAGFLGFGHHSKSKIIVMLLHSSLHEFILLEMAAYFQKIVCTEIKRIFF